MLFAKELGVVMQPSPFRLPRKTPFGVAENLAEWATGLKRLDQFYQQRPANLDTEAFIRYTLEVLGIDYQIQRGELSAVPREGPLLIVANHPLGAVEGVILAQLLGRVRSDLKILANHYLNALPELADLFIGVDVFEGESAVVANIRALRVANRHLSGGGALLVFPAGEVSTIDKITGHLVDKEWSRSVARLIHKTQATTIPIYINGRNSRRFYAAGKIHPRLRTLMLGHELLNKRREQIDVAIGEPIPYREVKHLPDETRLVHYLRLNTYLLRSTRHNTSPNGAKEKAKDINVENTALVPVNPPIEATLLSEEISALPHGAHLLNSGEFSVYCAPACQIPLVLAELGRIREINFRAVGEGTGQAEDLDQFDAHYQHLFVWDRKALRIVGAYRLGVVKAILSQLGVQGLYSRTLFQYDERFLNKLGDALELGRSVVSAEYQRSLSALLLLWKGIATYVSRYPQISKLFGPVSISNDYHALVRQLIAETMTVHHYDPQHAALVSPRHPLPNKSAAFWQPDMLSSLVDLQLLNKVIGRMDEGKAVPVLLRQYLGLNGKLVCFNVDPAFNDALDGLIVVDLRQVPVKTLSKYMGTQTAFQYLERHNAI
uniref:lysophospholipid acyltransferase family protein n=1 Tax=Thaumasiovibrio occultus TaxID=1891184 RepID=UPI000B34F579|nr:GNAT family N-acyltransferase [Thaumasiovibrio occultus]